LWKGKIDININCFGQAALALMGLYDIDPHLDWLYTARDILQFQATVPEKVGNDLLHDHWFLIAAEKLFVHGNKIHINKQPIIDKVVSISKKMIDNQRRNIEQNGYDSPISGALDPFGYCCHTSHETQGLASAALLLRGEGLTQSKAYQSILDTMYLSTQMMFRCQTHSGGLADTVQDALSNPLYEVFLDAPGHALGLG